MMSKEMQNTLESAKYYIDGVELKPGDLHFIPDIGVELKLINSSELQKLVDKAQIIALGFEESIDNIESMLEAISELYKEIADTIVADEARRFMTRTEQHDRRYANTAAIRSIKSSRRPKLKIKGYRHLYKCRR